MEFSRLSLFVLLASLPAVLCHRVTLIVDGTKTIAETDEDFICATLDWWPHDKCNYNICPWGYTSVLNLNLSHPFLAHVIQAFKNLRIRIGGSLQDQVEYDIGKLRFPCHPFRKDRSGLFGFSRSCLRMSRWDELNHLFSKTGARVTFGLNALYGRRQLRKGVWGGDWDSTNAYEFMKYTVAKGYPVDSWEFGNELSGSGIGASVGAEQYGKDLIALKGIIDQIYKNHDPKPSVIAPGGFFDQDWYARLLQVSGSGVIDFMTHHIYNLGPGSDPNLISKILDPNYLNRISDTFSKLKETIRKNGPWASPWVGESGGAYNSGGLGVSNTFVNSFWYLDQLGMAAKYSTKVYCRQSLIGGNYGLLNTTTFIPNPDYYSALLWNRLMGKGVLSIDIDSPSPLRSYAHCSRGREGVTLLLINFSNETNYKISVRNRMNLRLRIKESMDNRESIILRGLKKMVSFIGIGASEASLKREEYHLTPRDGFLQSQTMLLNGTPLDLTEDGKIPTLEPSLVGVNSPISIAPLSIAFVVLPNFDAPSCV
ncbi:heparanase-like protein 1 [Punica granatum]|uniref:Uncharacterized protein n=2 Tax=Punica granatum TaxID=22663 RepID=A0A218Y0R6_PUNGR|nr:heparanase-like protein 1 [Punica granatum]XP_031373308.1 heparanase-like protein 1 [Punica granatum]XP_031373309.1 heparanase-like protein 1 [Punica granatum]OWM90391.1 hypothetical protein CDL15_Pgr014693 [Punica granatum]PKI77962.1 hypothetical protein CRG98_001582 [Punica granatum]